MNRQNSSTKTTLDLPKFRLWSPKTAPPKELIVPPNTRWSHKRAPPKKLGITSVCVSPKPLMILRNRSPERACGPPKSSLWSPQTAPEPSKQLLIHQKWSPKRAPDPPKSSLWSPKRATAKQVCDPPKYLPHNSLWSPQKWSIKTAPPKELVISPNSLRSPKGAPPKIQLVIPQNTLWYPKTAYDPPKVIPRNCS